MKKTTIIALDVSGSMPQSIAEVHVKAAEKLAKGTKILRLVFDVTVKQVKSFYEPIIAHNGTDYDCIEKFIHCTFFSEKDYPNVIVITDGYGSPPRLLGTQDKWTWLIVR